MRDAGTSPNLRGARSIGRVVAAALAALVGVASCQGRDTLPSPTLRVDLRDRLPHDVLRRLLAVDTTYECSRQVELAAQGASQKFDVSWRVFRFKESLHITAVQVDPAGPTQGGTDPQASAAAEPTRMNRAAGGAEIAVVPIRLTWSATSGCATLGDKRTVALRADAPGCKPDEGTLKIFEGSDEQQGAADEQEGAPDEQEGAPDEQEGAPDEPAQEE